MKIMILGGHGFIGSHLCNILISQGHWIDVVDAYQNYNAIPQPEYDAILSQRIEHSRFLTRYPSNICDVAELKQRIYSFRPEVIVHLATYPNAHFVKNNPVNATENMVSVLPSLVQFASEVKTRRIVFSSSSMVYGDFNDVEETAPCNPNTLYGVLKYSGEQILQSMCRDNNMEYSILRPSAVYGTRDMIIRVISKMVESSIKNNIINVNNNGSLDFTWVEDVANYFALAATHPGAANQIFNATRGVAREITEVAAIVSYMLKSDVSLNNGDGFYPSRGRLNSDKIINTLGYKPQIDIESGIPTYINWFLEQSCYRDIAN